MIITMNIIAEKLNDMDPVFTSGSMGNHPLDGILLYTDTMEVEGGYVYLIKGTTLCRLDRPAIENGHFIVLDDAMLKSQKSTYSGCSLLLLNDGDVLSIANRIIHLFTKFSGWDRAFHQAIMDGTGLDEIVQYISGIMDFPAMIFDPSFRIIAYTKKHTVDIDEFNTAITAGYTSADRMDTLYQINILSRLSRTDKCIIERSAVDNHMFVAYRRHVKEDTTVAYSCIFFGNFHPTAGVIDLAECFFKNLDFYFIETARLNQIGSFMYEYMLSDLISDKKSWSKQELEDRLRYIDLNMNGTFLLLLLDFDNQPSVPLNYLCNLIKVEDPSMKPFVHENFLYILCQRFNTPNDDDYAARLLDRLRLPLKKYHFMCYVSNEFDMLTAIYDAAIQCVALRSINERHSQKPNRILYYNDYWFEHCIYLLSRQLDPRSLLAPGFVRILKEDRASGGKYLVILKAFIRNNGDYQKAAGELNLHRNTVAYRLRNLCAKAEVDLEDYHTRVSLDYSLKILDFLEENNLPQEAP